MSIDAQPAHGEKVRRTLMSIDAQQEHGEKVRKALNLFFASGAPLVIKVLTDLENRHNTFFYRHIGPEGPKETTCRKNGASGP